MQACSLAPFAALQTLHVGQQQLPEITGLEACAQLEVRPNMSPAVLTKPCCAETPAFPTRCCGSPTASCATWAA